MLFLQFEGNGASVVKTDAKYISEQQSDDPNPISELCVYEMLTCRNCSSEIGRLYLATTEMYDQIRMKFLLFGSSIQCQDAISCELLNINEEFQETIILNANKKDTPAKQQSSSNRQSINMISRDSGVSSNQRQSNRNSSSSYFKVKKEQDSEEDNIQKQINHISQTVKTFNQSLNEFDDRVSNSQYELSYLMDKVEELTKLLQSSKNQQASVHSNFSANKQDLTSTPMIYRNQFEGYQSGYTNRGGNQTYGYKSEESD